MFVDLPVDFKGSCLSPRYIIREIHGNEYYRYDIEAGTVETIQMIDFRNFSFFNDSKTDANEFYDSNKTMFLVEPSQYVGESNALVDSRLQTWLTVSPDIGR